MKDTILHGEAVVFKSQLPEGAKKLNVKGKYKIIAESEVTGNHHVIDINDGVEFYKKDGTLYMKNETPTQVRCVLGGRHDNITLEPNVWEVGFQNEYDYLTEQKRRVAD